MKIAFFSILNRYITKEVLSFFSICLLSFIGILLTLRILKISSLVINKGVDLGQVVMVFVAIIPTFLEIAIPLSALLAVMLAFARLSGDSEIIVLRAGGISIKRLIIPLVLIGGIVGFTALGVSHYLKPMGFKALSETLFEIARSKVLATITEGVFNKVGSITLYAESIDYESGTMANVIIDDLREEGKRRVITSKDGTITFDKARGSIVFGLMNGAIHERLGPKYIVTSFQQNILSLSPVDLYPDGDSSRSKKPKELTTHDLVSIVDEIPEVQALLASGNSEEITLSAPLQSLLRGRQVSISELNKKRHQVSSEIQLRYALPFAAFVLTLLGLPLGIHPARAQQTWGVGLSLVLGMIVFVAYYVVLSVGLAFSESGRIPVWLATWGPNIGVSVVSLFFIHKLSTEQWDSVPDGLLKLKSFVLGR